ncbi:hypothetical protein CTEN210_18270 [Chaetoceros tenuissimus]|uniref:Helicase-associated domain-containing protein n=1 Tax=Chaetoceros tenuissimus TaxID=426638 RepID=A0AAD3DC84_9STRA|nr:hypothetical protein CTEN210_18270 [Chaetoceros tenuissimus]
MLNDISFDWTAPTATRKESTWSDKFEQLKLYKSKHGDYNVSYTYDKKLANWVQRQRSQYKHSKLSDDHIEMLNDIKFNWMVPIQQKDITWYDKFEELRHYKSKHGDYNVPSRYKENQLGSWVHRQRYHYKLSKLSEERINMLNDIGFNWTAPTKEQRTEKIKILRSQLE